MFAGTMLLMFCFPTGHTSFDSKEHKTYSQMLLSYLYHQFLQAFLKRMNKSKENIKTFFTEKKDRQTTHI